jgi:flagellar basal body-associated protein FliL
MADDTENEETATASEGQEAAPKKKLPLLALLAGAQTLATIAFGGVVIVGLQQMNQSSVTPQELADRTIASVRDEVSNIQWIDLDPFVTNTVTKSSLRANLNVEVKDPQTAELLRSRMPAIRARILTLLSQQDGRALRRMQDKLLLKEALRETINQELARSGAQPGVIRDVYLLDFMIR